MVDNIFKLTECSCVCHRLNLTVASHVHLMEPQWNPMVESQALDRVHRLGQTRPVKTYRYIAKNTFDEVCVDHELRKYRLNGRHSQFSRCRRRNST